jgi:hypothetical protein
MYITGHDADVEEMRAAEIEPEGGLGNVGTAVAAALGPAAMVGCPVLVAALLECGVRLPAILLGGPASLLLPRQRLLR